MKKISVLLMTGCLLLSASMNAQPQPPTDNKVIAPHPLAIAFSKTTHLIFPYAIISVDRGSRDLLAQKAKGVENILQVKAARESFPQTNLTVVTADGKLTSFVVDYTEQPAELNIAIDAAATPDRISLPLETVNQQEVEDYAVQALDAEAGTKKRSDKSFGMVMELNGIFVHENVIYLRIGMNNRTPIHYDIDQFRLYIRDQKKAKRTASQEIEIVPVVIHQNTEVIRGNTEHSVVVAVPKFTIPDKKYLVLQIMEKNGGRHLELQVKNRQLIKAKWMD